MSKFCEREKKWDIKILDLMKNNIHKERVFYDPFHPTGKFFAEMVKQILQILKCDSSYGVETNDELEISDYEYPIYGCVQNFYKITDDNIIRKRNTGAKLKNVMDLEEYVREYRLWCFADRW